ncbi:CHAD domain-containing protein [Chitinophagaceae bacterium LB-8]|uniref:CHAD domain-containing protein n=1 Tax=Paraflavisolibacter caeni TaxID=2982496 RepID=A0A9X3BI45_9BACT|nr:CHAD domain-containing protein [Paraflavisolibacter caeni]MCU7550687.1 CHAD domain-containing protein [Paraflavisolibacter caeni]
MKKAYLEEVINKRLLHMKTLCAQITGTYDIEDIHDLRVEYKKLRAFIRLLQGEEESSKLKVPGKLKAIYETAGPVRDLQLFLPLVNPYFSQQPSQQYLERLQQKSSHAKNDLQQAIEKASFDKAEESILSNLPKSLRIGTVKKFVQHKITAIQTGLLSIHHDEDLHTIRKQLKDLIYNIKTYRNDFNQPFPVSLGNSEEDLNHAAHLLGKYNDLCFALTFLQTHKEEGLPENETRLLEHLESEWLTEKETRQAEVIQKLTDLHLGPVQLSKA